MTSSWFLIHTELQCAVNHTSESKTVYYASRLPSVNSLQLSGVLCQNIRGSHELKCLVYDAVRRR